MSDFSLQYTYAAEKSKCHFRDIKGKFGKLSRFKFLEVQGVVLCRHMYVNSNHMVVFHNLYN